MYVTSSESPSTPSRVWLLLEPETSNVGYLDSLAKIPQEAFAFFKKEAKVGPRASTEASLGKEGVRHESHGVLGVSGCLDPKGPKYPKREYLSFLYRNIVVMVLSRCPILGDLEWLLPGDSYVLNLLAMTCVLTGAYNILPKNELHRSLQVGVATAVFKQTSKYSGPAMRGLQGLSGDIAGGKVGRRARLQDIGPISRPNVRPPRGSS